VYGSGFQVLQIGAWDRTVIKAPAEKDRGAATTSLPVRPVAKIVHKPEGPIRI
jgi:hypothetical protein